MEAGIVGGKNKKREWAVTGHENKAPERNGFRPLPLINCTNSAGDWGFGGLVRSFLMDTSRCCFWLLYVAHFVPILLLHIRFRCLARSTKHPVSAETPRSRGRK